MLQKNLLNLLLLISLAACSPPPDVPICTELVDGELGWCTFTITDKEFYVDNVDHFFKDTNGKLVTWKQLRATSLIVPATSQAKISAYIITNCKKHNDCAKDIGKWSSKLNKVQKKPGAK